MKAGVLFLALMAVASSATAHPLSFGVLEVRSEGGGRYALSWRFSGTEQRARGVGPVLPARCRAVGGQRIEALDDGGEARRWRVDCGARPLGGERLTLVGMEHSGVQILVRSVRLDGAVDTAHLDDLHRAWSVPTDAPSRGVGGAFALGVEHIATGYDHLLFVLGLLLLAASRRRVIAAVTAFTAGHSVTLALASLGWAHLAPRAVEAAIAWSLVLVATELTRATDAPPTLARRWPWLMAFAFGLLHGFGFASALSSVGLAPREVAWNLLGFNLGVEAGQLAFVALCGLLARALPKGVSRGVPYVIGVAGAWLLLSRAAGFR